MAKKKNYKQKHVLIASLSIIVGVLGVIPFNLPNSIMTVLELVPVVLFIGPYEKVDELVEHNLNKANKLTMTLLIIMLIIFSLLVNNKVIITANAFSCAACIAVGIRSILFLWYDRNLSVGTGEE